MYSSTKVLFSFYKWSLNVIGAAVQLQSGQSLTPDSPPEDLAGSSEVVRSTGGVGVHPLAQESKVLHCGETRCVLN